jgi:hypothetical protein
MTFGFALMSIGSIMMLSGYEKKTIGEVLSQLQTKPTGGETGLSAYLKSGGAAINAAVTGPGKTSADSTSSGSVPSGLTTFDGHPVCKWIAEELEWARKHGWSGQLESGHRSYQQQVQACANTTGPCAEPGTSNHEDTHFPGCAADVTEPEELDRVLTKKIGRRLHWTGKSIGDDVHFSSGLQGV